ncbi:unnamed protein product [Prunus armeniaca]|uniref:Uncharacterized protein n=1 Tax=Prunus armeniaca TaxID=36596 RepID=A0A6J5WJ00_PRUAR|nr:unnamed protein product [Prunus armeniaca]
MDEDVDYGYGDDMSEPDEFSWSETKACASMEGKSPSLGCEFEYDSSDVDDDHEHESQELDGILEPDECELMGEDDYGDISLSDEYSGSEINPQYDQFEHESSRVDSICDSCDAHESENGHERVHKVVAILHIGMIRALPIIKMMMMSKKAMNLKLHSALQVQSRGLHQDMLSILTASCA